MSKLFNLSKAQAIKIMDTNLEKIRKISGNDRFLLLSYDMKNNISKKRWLNKEEGKTIIEKSKTFILNFDSSEEDPISVLSMYTVIQEDIYNILLLGEKHDMIIM